MHGCKKPEIPADTASFLGKKDISAYEDELQKIEERRVKIFKSLGIESSKVLSYCVVRKGRAAKEIIKEAEDSEAEVIITGTHGSSGLRETLFGTHTWEVIKHSPVPVLAVPGNALYKGVRNIVFATEYRQGEIPAISYLAHWAKMLSAQLTVIHVSNYAMSKEAEGILLKDFQKQVTEKIPYNMIKLHLMKSDDITDGLNRYCLDHGADLLAMSPEKPFFIAKLFNPVASVTRKMVYHTKIPLMTIPDFYDPAYLKLWSVFEPDDIEKGDF